MSGCRNKFKLHLKNIKKCLISNKIYIFANLMVVFWGGEGVKDMRNVVEY